MAKAALDSYKRLTALKAVFDAARVAIDARFGAVDAKFDAMDAKLEFLRADIKAEVKASQLQNLLWLSGITLASNGIVIALLARATKVL